MNCNHYRCLDELSIRPNASNPHLPLLHATQQVLLHIFDLLSELFASDLAAVGIGGFDAGCQG